MSESMSAADRPIPTFSVVIPTWNRAAVVGRAVSNVLAQTFDDFELIVVDDGSSDETPAVLSRFSDDRMIVVTQPNSGESAARNAGCRAATGAYLTYLDSDDEVRTNWLESFHHCIEADPADVIVCGQEALDSEGRRCGLWSPGAGLGLDELAVHFEAGQVAIRRELFLQAGGFETAIGYGQHTELAIRLFSQPGPPPRFAVLPDALSLVHRQPNRDYQSKQVESARFVLSRYPELRTRFPHISGSYHAMVGVDLARRHDLRAARRHFVSALRSEPRQWRHALRLVAALSPPLARRAWSPATP